MRCSSISLFWAKHGFHHELRRRRRILDADFRPAPSLFLRILLDLMEGRVLSEG